jgi:RNA polymerase sigma factor (sigma-70 family)
VATTTGAEGRRRPRGAARSPLTPEQQALASRYIPLARSIALRWTLAWPKHADEFRSAAYLALVEAAESFDPARRVKFATFARYRITGALRDVQRHLIRAGLGQVEPEARPMVRSLVDGDEEIGRVLGLAGPDEEHVGDDVEDAEWVEAMTRCLPARHRQVCRLVFLDDLNQGEAAAAAGISRSYVSVLFREALGMLAEEYGRRVARGWE